MRERSICRRCHRIRPVDDTRCCPSCAAELRAMGLRRPLLCPHCVGNGIRASLQPTVTERGEVQRCWQCGGEYRDGVCVWPEDSPKDRGTLPT